MRFSLLALLSLCSSISIVPIAALPAPDYPSSQSGLEEHYHHPKCKAADVVYRKEWRALSKPEKKSYIDAVRCIQTKTPSLYKGLITGAKSRADDFQIVHIEQTFIIHFNAQFLGWHRWFTWAYEQTLKKECGYKGAQPYWDWTLDAADIAGSPLFDGSEYSFSGNGKPVTQPDLLLSIDLPPAPKVSLSLKPGSGGGCVTNGPFANHVVNFGRVSLSVFASLLNNPKNLAYKPHCLVRDFNQAIAGPALVQSAVNTLLSQPNITAFNAVINFGTVPGVQGVHGGGHFGIGGDMSDTFSSPADPMFFLHHAAIDRMWTLWQQKDPKTRQYAISGTGTLLNYPPSPVFKLSDKINLGKLSPGGPRPLAAFMDTVRGPFCYEYK